MVMDIDSARTWIGFYGDGIEQRVDELNKLDAALGDGDFGASMQRGMTAVAETLGPIETDSIGDTSTLADPEVVEHIVDGRQ